MQFRKIPVVIDAIQFDGSNYSEVMHFMGFKKERSYSMHEIPIATRYGVKLVRIGDYVIRGMSGEFSPCRAEEFEKDYEMVDQ